MTGGVFRARRRKLQGAVKQAVMDLLAHENIAPEGISFPLDENLYVTLDPKLLEDGMRVGAMELMKMNVGPGLSFAEEAKWNIRPRLGIVGKSISGWFPTLGANRLHRSKPLICWLS